MRTSDAVISACTEAMSILCDLASDGQPDLSGQSLTARCLVSDDIKLKIFEFVDNSSKCAEGYLNSHAEEDAERLYREMDKAHNVPHEIFLDNRDGLTKYGNFFNK